jgi:hypothetical protein
VEMVAVTYADLLFLMRSLFPLIFKPRLIQVSEDRTSLLESRKTEELDLSTGSRLGNDRTLQHMQNDVVGIDSIAESCRKMFEQTKTKAFKREGRRIFTVSQ